MTSLHIAIKDLPYSLQNALKGLGYNSKDIMVKVAETYSVNSGGSQGRRSFACMVNLATGEREVMMGSWGGSNIFNPNNHVDLDTTSRNLPSGFAFISGSSGYGPTYASIKVHPSNLTKLFPEHDTEALSDKEKDALRLFGYKGGPYRKEEARRKNLNYSCKDPLFASLIERGYIKVNKAGSMQITTKGKNAKS